MKMYDDAEVEALIPNFDEFISGDIGDFDELLGSEFYTEFITDAEMDALGYVLDELGLSDGYLEPSTDYSHGTMCMYLTRTSGEEVQGCRDMDDVIRSEIQMYLESNDDEEFFLKLDKYMYDWAEEILGSDDDSEFIRDEQGMDYDDEDEIDADTYYGAPPRTESFYSNSMNSLKRMKGLTESANRKLDEAARLRAKAKALVESARKEYAKAGTLNESLKKDSKKINESADNKWYLKYYDEISKDEVFSEGEFPLPSELEHTLQHVGFGELKLNYDLDESLFNYVEFVKEGDQYLVAQTWEETGGNFVEALSESDFQKRIRRSR